MQKNTTNTSVALDTPGRESNLNNTKHSSCLEFLFPSTKPSSGNKSFSLLDGTLQESLFLLIGTQTVKLKDAVLDGLTHVQLQCGPPRVKRLRSKCPSSSYPLRAKLLQRDIRKFHIEGNNYLSDENN